MKPRLNMSIIPFILTTFQNFLLLKLDKFISVDAKTIDHIDNFSVENLINDLFFFHTQDNRTNRISAKVNTEGKSFRFCHNAKHHRNESSNGIDKEKLEIAQSNAKPKNQKTYIKRSISNRCTGQGKFYINSRNILEVFCDFSRCYDGEIVSNIIWERDGNLNNPWYTPYNDPDCTISRLGRYESLLQIRNYRPDKDDGRYRCFAQMRFYYGRYTDCYRTYRYHRHYGCRYRQNIQTVFGNIDVYGRSYNQNPNFIYDNIGYGHQNYRYRY